MAVARVQFVDCCSNVVVDMDMAAAVPTSSLAATIVVVVVAVPGRFSNPCTLCAAVSRASLIFNSWRAAFLPGTGRSQPNNSRTYIHAWITGVRKCMRDINVDESKK